MTSSSNEGSPPIKNLPRWEDQSFWRQVWYNVIRQGPYWVPNRWQETHRFTPFCRCEKCVAVRVEITDEAWEEARRKKEGS